MTKKRKPRPERTGRGLQSECDPAKDHNATNTVLTIREQPARHGTITVAEFFGLPRDIQPQLIKMTAEALVSFLSKLEDDYDRSVRLDALRKRRRWRKADVVRLLDIGVKPAAQRRIMRLLSNGKTARGRGVVPLRKSLAEKLIEFVNMGNRLFDPATPALERRALYKKTPWWPYFIEAAYRGEIEKIRGSTASPKAFRIAEANVANAANVSPAVVRKLCNLVRKERGDAPPDDPAMSAADLKEHLENGPAAGLLRNVPD